MIVGFQPGGTVRDARVVLKPEETIPNFYNVADTVVYRENPEDRREWLLVKPKGVVLPEDSPLLSQPDIGAVDISSLTTEENPDSLYEHRDIIRLESE